MNIKKDIIYISRKWPPSIGGMEVYAVKIYEGINRVFNVFPIILKGRSDGMAPKFWQIIGFALTAFFRLMFVKKVPDAIHICDLASWGLFLAFKMRSRLPKVIISVHGTDISYYLRKGLKAKLYSWYLRLAVRLLPKDTVIIVNSKATKCAVEALGFSGVVIIPLATDLRPKSFADMDVNSLFFAGRLTPRKGLSWFVYNVLPLLDDEIILSVAGTVWDEEEAKCLNHPQINYLGGISQTELSQNFSQALCVIIPNIEVSTCEFEGFGLVAPEAAVSGGVVLAADLGGLKNAVLDKTTGFLLESGAPEVWVKKINEIQNWTYTERKDYLKNSILVAEEFFNWNRVIADTIKSYGL